MIPSKLIETNIPFTCVYTRLEGCEMASIDSTHNDAGMTRDDFFCSHGSIVRIVIRQWM